MLSDRRERRSQTGVRMLECLLLFGAGPLLVREWIPEALWPYLLALAALLTMAWLGRRQADWLRSPEPGERARLAPMLWRFGLCAALLIGLFALLAPERLFQLPRERTGFWLVLMASYPLLSVLPQELVYRQLFE